MLVTRNFSVWLAMTVVAPGAMAISAPSSHSITPVRVLLERDADAAVIRSPSASLFARVSGGAWKQLGGEARLRLAKSVVYLNDEPVVGPVYLRGGRRIDDSFEVSDERFRGALKVVPSGGSLLLANVLPLEDYLVATVAAEMVPSWEIEALKAQAVASRTYALYMMKHPRDGAYDLDRTTNDQVYGDLRLAPPRVALAVAATAGEFLSSTGTPLKAYFHSRCGGATDTSRDVWQSRDDSPKRGMPCPFCRGNPLSWSAAVTIAELAKALELPTLSPFGLHFLERERSTSGRLKRLEIASGKTRREVTAEQLRRMLGYRRLKSARFGWSVEPEGVRFFGVGNGHGVGMCQWGAQFLARQGKSYREILAHYYPGAQLLK